MEFHADIFSRLLHKAMINKIISLAYEGNRAKLVAQVLGVKVTLASISADEVRKNGIKAAS